MLKFEEKYWTQGIRSIAGIDEAGRGPLAGPVVAAAVILTENVDLPEVNDSKKISEKKREILFDDIHGQAVTCFFNSYHCILQPPSDATYFGICIYRYFKHSL